MILCHHYLIICESVKGSSSWLINFSLSFPSPCCLHLEYVISEENVLGIDGYAYECLIFSNSGIHVGTCILMHAVLNKSHPALAGGRGVSLVCVSSSTLQFSVLKQMPFRLLGEYGGCPWAWLEGGACKAWCLLAQSKYLFDLFIPHYWEEVQQLFVINLSSP